MRFATFFALTSLLGANAVAVDRDPFVYRSVIDDFKRPFTAADAKWAYFTFGGYIGNDGIATTTQARGGRLRVASPGKNAKTGEPAFTLTADPNGGVPGDLDHVKWLAFANHTSSAGYPGYDTSEGYVTSCEAVVGGRTYGTEFQPFGKDISDDPSLAFVGAINGDFETFMIFDFAITNDAIYAFYERLPFGRSADHNYASFTALTRVGARNIHDMHRLRVSYDRSANAVTWSIDNREVYKITRIGHYPPDRRSVRIDRGGVEEQVNQLRQLSCGIGSFTLLDSFHLRDNKGLVRLNSDEGYYLNPSDHNSSLTFVDETSAECNRLFGQGSELVVSEVMVSSTRRGM